MIFSQGNPLQVGQAWSGILYVGAGLCVIYLSFTTINAFGATFSSVPGVPNFTQMSPRNPASIDPPGVVSVERQLGGNEAWVSFDEPIVREGYVALRITQGFSLSAYNCPTPPSTVQILKFRLLTPFAPTQTQYIEGVTLGQGAHIRDLDGNNALLAFERVPIR